LEEISEVDEYEVDLEKVMKEYGLGIDNKVYIDAKLKKDRKDR
jgi:hypothetical protein